MSRFLLATCFLASAYALSQRSSAFPPGWNGMANTPPLGWRSWNAFGNRITQVDMHNAVDAMTANRWTVGDEKNVSLADVGYGSVGVDEGWEGCGMGINGTQHAQNGDPVINKKFPDMPGLVTYGHKAGLKMGWYENGCACGERHALPQNYEGDVRLLHSFGFDGVKLDGCGAQKNMTLYAELMAATNKSYFIENCHWGKCTDSDDSSCPTVDWCPFNWYRTSGDINAGEMSWLGNLQTTIRFQDPKTPLSRPGCWAYPDMLEVGRIHINGKMDYNWNRAHFGAWCVVSAPLILGLDITQPALLEPIIDVIANHEAIAVNQAWAGHPGALVWSGKGSAMGYPAARPCNLGNNALQQTGWSFSGSAVKAPGGGCLAMQGAGYPGGQGGLVVVPCNTSAAAQNFTYDAATQQLTSPTTQHCIDVHSGGPIIWMYACLAVANDRFTFTAANGTLETDGKCVGMETADPAGGSYQTQLQAWAKPLAGSAVAMLLINPDTVAHDFVVPLSVLPFAKGLANASSLRVRDIWAHADLPFMQGPVTMKVGPLDSAFIKLSPGP